MRKINMIATLILFTVTGVGQIQLQGGSVGSTQIVDTDKGGDGTGPKVKGGGGDSGSQGGDGTGPRLHS